MGRYKLSGRAKDEALDFVVKVATYCAEVSFTTDHCLFFEYAPHADYMSVRAFISGWKSDAECDYKVETYCVSDSFNGEQPYELDLFADGMRVIGKKLGIPFDY